ncbi:Deoxycytidine triphosphate deaminase [Liberibacter crescens BT-1]|uniref:Deoxycytidine triphosphate deaminase n=2 Tax=Liberibacter crescens TaxID=1273132 RepID=L0EWR9_LIBCB|nr:Deoxycytidine triphosphate deaminase [Liberibacter crescens BT-1]
MLPDKAIWGLLESGKILTEIPLEPNQVQPASLDLRLSSKAYRIRASFLPGSHTVYEKLDLFKLHEIDLSYGAVLETNCIYIIPLIESLRLGSEISASINPKSSTGRLDIFTRVISDRSQEFDRIPAGYHGPLYLEISPRTFPVIVRFGSRLSQIRFHQDHRILDKDELLKLQADEVLVESTNVNISEGGIALSIDLEGHNKERHVGYRGKHHTEVIDVDLKESYRIQDFWDPLYVHPRGELILDPDEFYILVSREAVRIPPFYAAEMKPYDPLMGEFRIHYAGFLDPGFGYSLTERVSSRVVLEMRSHQVPFILEHGQIVGRLIYEAMLESPQHLYGVSSGSYYQSQKLKLSKHFKD